MKYKKMFIGVLLLILSFLLLFSVCKKTIAVSSKVNNIKKQVSFDTYSTNDNL